jgi:hypothetical protein
MGYRGDGRDLRRREDYDRVYERSYRNYPGNSHRDLGRRDGRRDRKSLDMGYRGKKKTLRRRKQRQRMIKAAIAGAMACVVLFAGIGMVRLLKGKDGKKDSAPKAKKEETLEDFAKKHDLTMEAYPPELLELLERNQEAKKFVWEYPLKKDERPEIDLSEYADADEMPLLMQWDQRWGYTQYSGNVMGLTGCGPTCLSMVAMYLSNDTTRDPAWMAEFSTENGYAAEGSGTAWALFSEGGERLGFDVTEIPLDEKRIADNLEVGNPVVAVMGPGAFTTEGHFIVFTRYENGKLRVNDPNSRANTDKPWDFEEISSQIKQLWVFRK